MGDQGYFYNRNESEDSEEAGTEAEASRVIGSRARAGEAPRRGRQRSKDRPGQRQSVWSSEGASAKGPDGGWRRNDGTRARSVL